MELLGDVHHRESCFGLFRTVLVSAQDSCTVCVMRTLGLEIILDVPDGTPGDEAKVDARLVCLEILLILTQDRCTICAERTTGSEINLDAPDGIPR
jgi:hypothetical protein